MSNPRPDPPRLAAEWILAPEFIDHGSSMEVRSGRRKVYDGPAVDALLSDLRTLEAQWREKAACRAPSVHPAPTPWGESNAFHVAANDLAALLARLEGQ
jgi:hypothetical protein